MKFLVLILVVMFAALQLRLWVGEGSLAELSEINSKIKKQEATNRQLLERNRLLAAEVQALRNDDEAIAERARRDLGMIGQGETFFMVVEPGRENLKR